MDPFNVLPVKEAVNMLITPTNRALSGPPTPLGCLNGKLSAFSAFSWARSLSAHVVIRRLNDVVARRRHSPVDRSLYRLVVDLFRGPLISRKSLVPP